ncbi:MAG: hypothetical protein E7B59_07885 [Enterobacteriaceae bacterium]|nr:hypothetical protein [Enterobacteriaceae bacterium]
MFKKILQLLLGPALGHILTVALTPLFMHFYTPVAFGEYAFFIALLGILVNVSVLRFDAILLFCEDNELNSVIMSGNFSTILFTSLISIILILIKYDFFLCFFFSLLALSTQLIITSIFLRDNKHYISSFFNFIFVSMVPISQLVFTFLHFPNGLIFGHSFAAVLYLIVTIPVIVYKRRCLQTGIGVKTILKKYKSYYTSNALSVFINASSNQFLPIILKIMFGTEVLGLVNVLQRILITPIGFVLRIIIQAYNKELAFFLREGQVGNANNLFKRTILFGFIGALLINSILLAVYLIHQYNLVDAENLISSKWSDITKFIPYFIMLLSFQIVSIPVSQSLTFLGFHFSQLAIEIARISAFLIIAVYSYYSHMIDLEFIKLYVFTQSLIYLVTLIIINSVFKIKITKRKI